MYNHHPLFLFHLNALPFSVRHLTLIKSRWDAWTWWVVAEHYRLIMWGEKGSSSPPYHHLSHSIVSFHISSPFISHIALISHVMGIFFPSDLQGGEEVCFLIRALDSRWIGATLGLAHRRLSCDFLWVMISEPDLSSSHSDCEISSQWIDNRFGWSSGFRLKQTCCLVRVFWWQCIQHFKVKCESHLGPFSSSYVYFTPLLPSFCCACCM